MFYLRAWGDVKILSNSGEALLTQLFSSQRIQNGTFYIMMHFSHVLMLSDSWLVNGVCRRTSH